MFRFSHRCIRGISTKLRQVARPLSVVKLHSRMHLTPVRFFHNSTPIFQEKSKEESTEKPKPEENKDEQKSEEQKAEENKNQEQIDDDIESLFPRRQTRSKWQIWGPRLFWLTSLSLIGGAIYQFVKEESEAIGLCLEEMKPGGKLAESPYAIYYLLFMANNVTNRKTMMAHFGAIMELLDSPDLETVRGIIKIVLAISDAASLRDELLEQYPQFARHIIQLAQHEDREVCLYSHLVIANLVAAVPNKIRLADAGLLDLIGKNQKKQDPELMSQNTAILTAWAESFDQYTKYITTSDQKEALMNSLAQMADVFMNNGMSEASLLVIDELLRVESSNAAIYLMKARALNGMGQYTEANNVLRKALRVPSADRDTRTVFEIKSLLASNLSNFGDRTSQEEALRLLQEAVEGSSHNPNAQDFFFLLAHTQLRLGKKKEATETLRRLVKIRPYLAKAHALLGKSLLQMRDYAGAEKALRDALRLKVVDSEVHLNLGRALSHQGRFNDAIDQCRLALAVKPELSKAHLLLGRCLFNTKQFDEAAQAFQKYTEANPTDPAGYYQLARLAEVQGDKAKSYSIYSLMFDCWLMQCPDQEQCADYFRRNPSEKKVLSKFAERVSRGVELDQSASNFQEMAQKLKQVQANLS